MARTPTPELLIALDATRMTIASPLPWGRRLFFALLALFPLLAPWELLVTTRWTDYANVFFAFAAVISLGAIALSLLLLFAAFAGFSSTMVFDRRNGTFTFAAHSPLIRPAPRSYRLADVRHVDVHTHEWSDGAPSYSLRVETIDGAAHDTASVWSRDEVEQAVEALTAFLRG